MGALEYESDGFVPLLEENGAFGIGIRREKGSLGGGIP